MIPICSLFPSILSKSSETLVKWATHKSVIPIDQKNLLFVPQNQPHFQKLVQAIIILLLLLLLILFCLLPIIQITPEKTNTKTLQNFGTFLTTLTKKVYITQ